jgi:phosphomannomutase
MDELMVAHGLLHPVQWSVSLPGLEGRERIRKAMESLRSRPLERIGASPVVRVLDAAAGEETVEGERREIALPRSDLVAFEAADGARLAARPSGTEPRIKFYLELAGETQTTAEVGHARARLEAEGQAFRRTLLERLGLG